MHLSTTEEHCFPAGSHWAEGPCPRLIRAGIRHCGFSVRGAGNIFFFFSLFSSVPLWAVPLDQEGKTSVSQIGTVPAGSHLAEPCS